MMINKIISALAIVIATIFGVYGYLNDIEFDQKMQRFMNVGNRFTASDGQELCEQVRFIAEHTAAYQIIGKPLPECHYLKKP